jgi:hypothetical protein
VAQDKTDQAVIWVTKLWKSKSMHQESRSLPSVKNAIAKGTPLIAGFGKRFETKPIGGHEISAQVLHKISALPVIFLVGIKKDG